MGGRILEEWGYLAAENLWLGGIPYVGEYVLRRIVDEQGQYTPAFEDMLSKVDNDCLVVVRR